jgi:ketosteroid isomerase-like protein
MSDTSEIIRLTLDYAWYLDNLDLDGVMEQFTDDAVMDATPIGLTLNVGKADVRAFFGDVVSQLSHESHLTSNHRVDVADDAATAVGTVYYDAHAVTLEGVHARARGFYEDEYRRTPSGWRISSRVVKALTPPSMQAFSMYDSERDSDTSARTP